MVWQTIGICAQVSRVKAYTIVSSIRLGRDKFSARAPMHRSFLTFFPIFTDSVTCILSIFRFLLPNGGE
jgi:hypothetical protein